MLSKAALIFVLAAAALHPSVSHAALKCEELVASRACADNSAHTVSTGSGSVSVSAPVIPGFPYACWVWSRKFQCVEANPTFSCASGTAYPTVKSDCNLTAAVVNSTTTVRGVSYITSATYNYRCAWGEFTTKDNLPANKDCAPLNSTVKDTVVASDGVATAQQRTDEYVCYSPPVTTCSDTCYEKVVNPATGVLTERAVPCSAPVTNCTTTATQCDNTLGQTSNGMATSTIANGPDGRCISSTESMLCQNGEVPKCLTQDNCQLSNTTPSSVQANGVARSEEQTYICTNTTKTCTQLTDVSNCVHAGAWGWDKLQIRNEVGAGLGEYNQAMSRLEGIEKGMKDNDPYIFSGQDMRCHFAVGNFLNTLIVGIVVIAAGVSTGGASLAIGASALNDAAGSKAFGMDCCKDYVIEGSDSWYKLGSCTGAEVKLAVARRKGLTRYLGEYCSKKSGFPLRQCVEKSRTFCVFDDMLAFTVNEQGRQQLDAIASADPVTTKVSSELPFPLFGAAVMSPAKYSGVLNTGKWVKQVQESGSQVWTWRYPDYCSSATKQSTAYALYQAELKAVVDTTGIQPDKMTPAQADALLAAVAKVASFQECPTTPGQMTYLTCSLKDDSCNTSKLPEGPGGVGTDVTGTTVADADVNWRMQQMRSFHAPGDYGVTSTMQSDATYAAVSGSVNEFITAIGSCHTNGNCLYRFAITDKVKTGGLGSRKRVTEYAQFPLYTSSPTQAWPAIDYLPASGELPAGAYMLDVNRGLGRPVVASTQRFIFHPHLLTTKPPSTIHKSILLEYANGNLDQLHPENDYTPMVVPTGLPPGSAGFYPYGNPAELGKSFYLSGGCDPNSRWCNYAISVDLNVPRHPWGSAEAPRCWGFSLEQLAALDFDKMDLSRWINSLDLSAGAENLSAEAASSMTTQMTKTAQSFYSTFEKAEVTNNPNPGMLALVTSTDVLPKLSEANFQTYTLQAAVPANWPKWFDDAPNVNPVTNVRVDWGDGSPVTTMPKDAGGRAYVTSHDYGDSKPGTYKIVVTLDTAANAQQLLSTKVRITPNDGQKPATEPLDFNSVGVNGKSSKEYTPSESLNQINVAPDNIQQVSPGTAEQFNQQGSGVTVPTKP